MASGTYERTAIWLMSESGDGKRSLAKRLGSNCAETDRVFIFGRDRLRELHPSIDALWDKERDLFDSNGVVNGNLSIGLFWQRVVDGGFINDAVDLMFEFWEADNVEEIFWLEGWVPDAIYDRMLEKFKELGFRVWVMQRKI